MPDAPDAPVAAPVASPVALSLTLKAPALAPRHRGATRDTGVGVGIRVAVGGGSGPLALAPNPSPSPTLSLSLPPPLPLPQGAPGPHLEALRVAPRVAEYISPMSPLYLPRSASRPPSRSPSAGTTACAGCTSYGAPSSPATPNTTISLPMLGLGLGSGFKRYCGPSSLAAVRRYAGDAEDGGDTQ